MLLVYIFSYSSFLLAAYCCCDVYEWQGYCNTYYRQGDSLSICPCILYSIQIYIQINIHYWLPHAGQGVKRIGLQQC